MLTQLATVKTRLRINGFDLDDDALITGLIRHASGRFALECNRTFDRGVDVTFEFRADQIDILPDRYPLESVASFDLKSNETDGWIAQPNIVYLFSPERCVVELATTLGNSRQKGRINLAQAPGLLQVRLEVVFLSTSRTKVYETSSQIPLSTALSASRRKLQRA